MIYSLAVVVKTIIATQFNLVDKAASRNRLILFILLISILVTGYEVTRFAQHFQAQRASAYNFQTEREQFYGIAEQMQRDGINEEDLVIVRVSDNDCWLRYNILFLTGAESKTLLEMYLSPVSHASIKEKYRTMYFYEPNGDVIMLGRFGLNELSVEDVKSLIDAFVNRHKNELEQEILRIKKDKTSCQWLVPDFILNAP